MTHCIYSTIKDYRTYVLAFVLSAIMPGNADAKPRSDKQMRQAAASLFAKRSGGAAAHAPNSASLKEMKRGETYVVYGRDGGGFAVIASDDVAPEVLGYSDAVFSSKIENANFNWWLQAVNSVVSHAAKNNAPMQRTTTPDPSRFDVSVPSLCSSRWGQEEPYWNMCPTGSAGRCLTGCVATAMSQVLYFHKGPDHGVGTRTIYYPANNTGGTPVTADFANDFYDWDNMTDTYTKGNYSKEQGDAVALLMRDCGVATNMNYAPDGSGAYHDQTADGLRRYFGLEDVKYVERSNYTEKQWMELIYDQVSRRLPVIYGGDDYSGGHSFVLDGYDADGLVHINWGWEGSDDGYYNIALLNPSGYSFSMHQDAVININPEPAVEMVSDTLTVSVPGTLQTLVDKDNFYRYDTLRVEGKINSSDLKTLRQMAGRDESGEKTDGTLRVLDLKAAKIVAGGDPYLYDGGTALSTTVDNVVPRKAFSGCNLRQLLLPDGIKSVGAGAWAECSRIDSVRLVPAKDADFVLKGNIMYSTDETAIYGALPRAGQEVYIGGKVEMVNDYAFNSCKRIRKVTFGSQLKSIGERSFASCTSISEIRMVGKMPVAIKGAGAFDGIDKANCKLYVRAGSTDKFKAAAQWNEFASITEYGTTVKARNAIREYGEENPRIGYSIHGDQVSGIPEVTCDATPTTPVGRHPIHISKGTITDDAVDYEEGFLIITKAPLTVGVEDATREEGEQNPEFTLTFKGFKNGEGSDVFTQLPVAECNADTSSPAGIYPITVSGGEAGNYELTYTEGKLTVTKGTTAISSVADISKADSIDIYSAEGKLLESNVKDISSLTKGIYVIKVRCGKSVTVNKIVIGK